MTNADPAPATWRARFRQAQWWLSRGIDVVPIKQGSKHLVRGFGASKRHITSTSEAQRWFLHSSSNLGVVLGGKAGLVVADWDDAEAHARWSETQGLNVCTRTEQTARGWHIFFFGQELTSGAGGGCDFLAHGVCMVTPSIHPSGAVYRLVNDAPINTLTPEQAEGVFPFLSDNRSSVASSRKFSPADSHRPQHGGTPDSRERGVVARIKAARSTVAEMTEVGIVLRPGGTNALVGRCPFHDDHHPSLWVNPKSGLWGCNRPDCPAAGVHDVINFRAMSRKIGIRSAIRELAKEYL